MVVIVWGYCNINVVICIWRCLSIDVVGVFDEGLRMRGCWVVVLELRLNWIYWEISWRLRDKCG
ncbi:hypothetical protein [Candidatus Hodgkinia cicadicola]|uniref:hypothetical protein n=1 Tax=Candidatus Hodgkinia cicadicola TaxID=573658 RepID=UPI0011BA65C6